MQKCRERCIEMCEPRLRTIRQLFCHLSVTRRLVTLRSCLQACGSPTPSRLHASDQVALQTCCGLSSPCPWSILLPSLAVLPPAQMTGSHTLVVLAALVTLGGHLGVAQMGPTGAQGTPRQEGSSNRRLQQSPPGQCSVQPIASRPDFSGECPRSCALPLAVGTGPWHGYEHGPMGPRGAWRACPWPWPQQQG